MAQSVGMDYVGPFTFLASRSYLGFVVLLPVIAFMDKAREKKQEKKPDVKRPSQQFGGRYQRKN